MTKIYSQYARAVVAVGNGTTRFEGKGKLMVDERGIFMTVRRWRSGRVFGAGWSLIETVSFTDAGRKGNVLRLVATDVSTLQWGRGGDEPQATWPGKTAMVAVIEPGLWEFGAGLVATIENKTRTADFDQGARSAARSWRAMRVGGPFAT